MQAVSFTSFRFLFFLCALILAEGQLSFAEDEVKSEPAWQRQAESDLKFRFGFEVPRYNIEVDAPESSSSSKMVLESNTPTKNVVGVSYRNLGVSLSTSNSPDSASVSQYGSSSSTDFQLRFFGQRTYEFFYQTYDGYYVKNSEDLDPAYKNLSYKIKRPDIRAKNIGLNFYWSPHDKDYSQAVAWDQVGWQNQSAWGASWLVHLSQNSIEADSVLIPSVAKTQFGNLGSLKDLHRNTLAGGLAIGGIATYNSFYASGLLGIGLGYQRNEAQFIGLPTETGEQTGSYVSLRLGLGYNGRRNIFNLQFLNDSVNSKISSGQVVGSSITLALSYAYRFADIDLPIFNQLSSYLD